MSKKISAAQKLYDDLLEQISSRLILPGAMLPSENLLCEKYAISRPTVRRVQEKLCRQNMIEKRPGIGTFVRSPESASNSGESNCFHLGIDALPTDASHYYSKILQGITRSSAGRNCMFSFLQGETLRQGIIPGQVDGLLLTRLDENDRHAMQAIKTSGKPAIIINRMPSMPEIAYLTVDHRWEAELAVTHLLRLGHRNIALIGGMTSYDSRAIRSRSCGWEDAFRKAGLTPPQHLCLDSEDLLSSSSAAREQFINTRSFSAAFFTNLNMLRTFLPEFSRCRQARLDDLELMCFDDLDEQDDLTHLNCSFVRMPLLQIGECAIEYLKNKKAAPGYPVLRKLFPCNMVIRHKTQT